MHCHCPVLQRKRAALLLIVCCTVQCQDSEDDKSKTSDPCSANDTIRLDARVKDDDCGLVEGRVQFCEGNSGQKIWKDLCDSHFTEEDARVICKSLGHSEIGK